MPPGRRPTDAELLDPRAAAAIDAALIGKRGLYDFVQRAWPTARPGDPFVGGWHIELICAHLEAVSRGEIKQLIIAVPPGSSKSTVTSVMWPAWDWITHPARKWIVSTYGDDLMTRDALGCRDLIQSRWYKERWGKTIAVSDSDDIQKTQGVWNTIGGGRRKSTTVKGSITGWHGNVILVDDPIKPEDMAEDPEIARNALDRVWTWWSRTMASRLLPGGARVIIMQRLHELDLIGRLIEDNAKDPITGFSEWEILMLPMEFEKDRACKTRWGADPRTVEGELLCPARFDARHVAAQKKTMRSQVAAAQLQQRPSPDGGNVFRRDWFARRWMRPDNPKWQRIPAADRELYIPLPQFFTGVISADCAFKDTAGADNVAVEAWGESGSQFFLIDCIADRMGMTETARCIEYMSTKYRYCRAKLIEDKANGPAVEQTLRKKMPGIVLITPLGGKVARANAISPLCEAGNVVLPDDSEAEWVGPFIEEMLAFPASRRDDRVDSATQALAYMYERNQGRYLEAMAKVSSGSLNYLGDR